MRDENNEGIYTKKDEGSELSTNSNKSIKEIVYSAIGFCDQSINKNIET
ncbi:MAG: hypothetical protein U9N10_06875 [Bacillota bacterium]|nr:hypothetical protein [Bacillota bacterium]